MWLLLTGEVRTRDPHQNPEPDHGRPSVTSYALLLMKQCRGNQCVEYASGKLAHG
jgi:hypothetical protein